MIEVIHTGPFQVNTLIVGLEGSSAFTPGEKVFLVDPACCDFSGDSYAVSRRLESLKLDLQGIILTHGHFDHVAGLNVLKSAYKNVPVFIHKKDACFIGHEGNRIQSESLSYMGFEDFIPYVTDLPEPAGYLEEGKTLADIFTAASSGACKGMENWVVLHTPGHTEGSCCLYNKNERTLIAGDTVFYHSWGRTDLPFGSETAIQKSLKRIYHEVPENTKVYPGHDYYGFTVSENM